MGLSERQGQGDIACLLGGSSISSFPQELSELIRSGFESIEKARSYFLVFVCDMAEPKQQGTNMTGNPKTEGQSSGTPSSDNSGEGKQKQQTNPQETRITTAKDEVGNVVKEILRELESSDRGVALTGSPGVGKTWLAKQITESAVSREGPFYMSLWTSLGLNQKKDEISLFQSIARQLSIPNLGSMWEDADDMDDDDKREEVADKELETKVRGELKKRYQEYKESNKGKEDGEKTHMFLLVVLDCEGEVKSEDYNEIMGLILYPNDYEVVKKRSNVLITSRELGNLDTIEKKVQPYSGDEAVAFLKDRVDNRDSLPKFQTLCADIRKRSQVLPAEIIMLAEALNHTATGKLDSAFDAAHLILKAAGNDDAIPLLPFIYGQLPEDNCLIDCFWHSWNLLGKQGGVQYNELIARWILEGHLDLADGIREAYNKGYKVMMELVDRGMLKMQEDNLIVLERATLGLEDRNCRELFEKSNLGLAGMLEDKGRKVFERMTPTDGMMKTVKVDKEGKLVSSLLIDGSRFSREDPKKFFEQKQHLEVLALFNPRLTCIPDPIPKMNNLLLLVIRGCYLLETVDCIKGLKELVALEITGSPLLKEMATDFFVEMTKLRSLNLSALGIKSLPDVFNLTELRRLILRNCTYLVTLPKLANLKDLEVFDVSGSSNLMRLQEKSFQSFHKLRFADFSGTSIEKLPIVQRLENLTILLVRGCVRLSGLRFMKHLYKLKVLDVSGATKIKEIFYDCFTDTDNLKILDLSETDIRFLPESLGKSLCDLKLKGCSKLERLLDTRNLTSLESLDLSDCSSLKGFPNNFFEHLTSLKSLDLSNSQVKSFPSHFELPYLRHLLLKNCSFESLPESKTFGSFDELRNLVELDLSGCKSPAEQLPSLEHLIDLEVINLSGYTALSEIDASFERMSWLQVLNLSETKVSSLPELSKPSKLRSLILNNCTQLRTSPDFGIHSKESELEELDLRGTRSLTNIKAESLSCLPRLKTLRLSKSAFEAFQSYLPNLKQLEVLDLSGEEDVESVPSLNDLNSLRQLLLGGCSKLNKLPSLNSLCQLEVLDLSGTKVTKIRDKIRHLKLKRLHLPEGVVEEFNGGIEDLPLELKLDHCYVSKPSEIPQGYKVPLPRIVVQGVEILKSLKEDSASLERIRHSISSVRALPKKEDNYSDSRKHIFSCIYSKIKKLPSKATDDQCLEIQGFDVFPSDIEVLLEHATYVFLVENGFLKNLSDLKADSLKNIRGCWLERCNNMEESIFVEADLGKWGTLEILWISNLPKLKGLYEEKVQSLSFGSIKHLYIDCCPKLDTVFPSWLIAENLETLQITFCDNLKTLFGDKGWDGEKEQTSNPEDRRPANKKEQRARGSEDKKVHETKSSAKGKVQPKSPINKKDEVQPETLTDKEEQERAQQPESLPDKEGKDAPKSLPDKEEKEEAQQPVSLPDKEEKDAHKSLPDKEENEEAQQPESLPDKEEKDAPKSLPDKEENEEAQQPESLPDKEEKDAPKSLPDKKENEEAQQPENLPDRAANPANMQEEQAVSSADMKKIKLKHLHISYCPMLETVFSSGQVPENLEILRVEHCDGLKSVFQPELNDRALPKLGTLHLSDLPAWTRPGYGFKLNESVTKHLRVSRVKGLIDISPDNASMEATPAGEN
ncbi:Nbs-lrr resistance-like protein [Gossypium australe]|uniref:Nbs-lrr resistance-like protein n=1 Tax=Gossypium australe TaxID=47621 RepID=A0A5B6VJR7_9ROSI|nr:Nbs-lrr resistance-like protein [Gossypium australe]